MLIFLWTLWWIRGDFLRVRKDKQSTHCTTNTKEVGISIFGKVYNDPIFKTMIQYSKYFTFSSTSLFQFRFFSTIPVRKQRIVWHARKRRRTPKPNILFRWLALKSFPPRTWNKICIKRKVGHQVLAKQEIHLVADLSTLGQDVYQGKT